MILKNRVHADCVSIFNLLTHTGPLHASVIRARMQMTTAVCHARLSSMRAMGWAQAAGRGRGTIWSLVPGAKPAEDDGLPGGNQPLHQRMVLDKLRGQGVVPTAVIAKRVRLQRHAALVALGQLRAAGLVCSAIERDAAGTPFAVWWLPAEQKAEAAHA